MQPAVESMRSIIHRLYPRLDMGQASMTLARGSIAEMAVKCRVCRDQGWVYRAGPDGKVDYAHPRRCACMARADWEKHQLDFLQYCELPAATEDRTLATFEAHHDSLRRALAAAQELVAGQLGLLVLAGGVDRGKTHLAIGICRAWLSRGKSAKYAFVPLLLDELRAGFGEEGDHSYQSRFGFYQKVELLALDDLGAEARTAWAVEKLETIIDYRYINSLATVVTTNCGLDEFTDRIRSRLQRWKNGRVVVIEAEEHRRRGKVASS